MTIKAVTFDLWLTLIWDNSELEEYRKLRRLANFHRFASKLTNGSQFSFNDVRLALEKVSLNVKGQYEQGYDVHPRDRGKMLFDFLNIKVPKDEEEEVYEKAGKVLSNSGYFKKLPNVNPEAKPTLKLLKEEFPHLKIALISNAARSASTYRRMFRSFGLVDYFDNLVISCEIGFLKPRKEIFHAALSSLEVKPQEALHIGDLFRADVVGASAYGMHAALYTGLWHKYAQYMNPGERVPKDFVPKVPNVMIAEIERLQQSIDLIRKIH